MNFHTYHDGAEVYIGDLSPDEIRRYKEDSARAAEQRYNFRIRKLRASIRWSLNSILNRMTLINSTVSVLAVVALPLLAQAHA